MRTVSIVHERPMHLFVVGDGLEYFTHAHPVQQRDGVFMLDIRGSYIGALSAEGP